jgi:hypothetical protein
MLLVVRYAAITCAVSGCQHRCETYIPSAADTIAMCLYGILRSQHMYMQRLATNVIFDLHISCLCLDQLQGSMLCAMQPALIHAAILNMACNCALPDKSHLHLHRVLSAQPAQVHAAPGFQRHHEHPLLLF